MYPDLFPTVEGRNLLGELRVLPRDLAGKLNLIVIAHHVWQQAAVDCWLPLAEQLEASVPGFTFYELPVCGPLSPAQQRQVDSAMRLAIPDHRTRQRTVTLYLDRAALCQRLGLPGDRDIALLLVDRGGHIRWRAAGPYAIELDRQLTALVQRQLTGETERNSELHRLQGALRRS